MPIVFYFKPHLNALYVYCILFQGLKTGMYYLRTKPAVNAIQFTVDKTALKEENLAGMVCSLENKDECMMCSA